MGKNIEPAITGAESLNLKSSYTLLKLALKKGCNSKVKVGTKKRIKLSEPPREGIPIMAVRDSSHPSGDPKRIRHKISTPVEKIRAYEDGPGLQITTRTSVYLLKELVED
jgi:hypothetical protein